jgi:hypothetical protein
MESYSGRLESSTQLRTSNLPFFMPPNLCQWREITNVELIIGMVGYGIHIEYTFKLNWRLLNNIYLMWKSIREYESVMLSLNSCTGIEYDIFQYYVIFNSHFKAEENWIIHNLYQFKEYLTCFELVNQNTGKSSYKHINGLWILLKD